MTQTSLVGPRLDISGEETYTDTLKKKKKETVVVKEKQKETS